MAHDVFVSYSADDKPTADAVCAALETRDIRCWIAPRDVTPGVTWAAAIVQAIHSSRVFVLVFSARANASQQVLREVERAVSAAIPVIPFRIEAVTPSDAMEYFLGAPHWLDAMTPPLQQHLDRLCTTVAFLLSPDENHPSPSGSVARGTSTDAHAASVRPPRGLSRRQMLIAGGVALAAGAGTVAVLAVGRTVRGPVRLEPEKASPAQAVGTRSVKLAPPFQTASVAGEDAGALAKLDATVTDLGIVLPQLAQNYAPPPPAAWVLHLTSDEATARRVLTEALAYSQGDVNSFINNRMSFDNHMNAAAGLQTVAYLANISDLRGVLAEMAGFYYLFNVGGIDQPDVYPFWFQRGLPVYLHTYYSEAGYSPLRTAAADVSNGTAPSLASLSLQSDALAFMADSPDKLVHIDARSWAAVNYLVSKYNEPAVGRLFHDDAHGSIVRFNGLLQQVTGMTVDELNSAVDVSLR